MSYLKSSKNYQLYLNEFHEKYRNLNIFEDQNCYICGNKEFKIINNKDRYDLEYPTGLCSNCGNIQQVKYYSKEVLVDLYTNYYHQIYNSDTAENIFVDMKKGRAQAIFSFTSKIIKPKKVLEVGYGAGGNLSIFKDRGCEVLGLDFDENKLNVAKKKMELL